MALSKGFTHKTIKVSLNFDMKEWHLRSNLSFIRQVANDDLADPKTMYTYDQPDTCSVYTKKLYKHLFFNSTVPCHCGAGVMFVSKTTDWSNPCNMIIYDCDVCISSIVVCTLNGNFETSMMKIITTHHRRFYDFISTRQHKYHLDNTNIPYVYDRDSYSFYYLDGYYVPSAFGIMDWGESFDIEKRPIKNSDLQYLRKLIPKSDK